MATSSRQLYRFHIQQETSQGILAAVDGSDESTVTLLEVTPDPENLESAFKTLADLADKQESDGSGAMSTQLNRLSPNQYPL